MVVLDQYGVEESRAVQDPASHLHGVALERPQPGQRLARAEDDGLGAGARADVRTRQRGDPGEMGQEVQRHALPRQHDPGVATQGGQGRPRGDAAAVARDLVDRQRTELPEDAPGHLEPGEHPVRLRDDPRLDLRPGRHDALGRDVAGSDVLRERAADGLVEVRGELRHRVRKPGPTR